MPLSSFSRHLGNVGQLLRGRTPVLADALREIDDGIRQRVPLNQLLSSLDGAKDAVRGHFQRNGNDAITAAALTLKLLNLLLAKYHFQERSTDVIARPFGLLVDPSNGCNLACPGCVQSVRAKSLRLFDWQNGMLPEDRFAALLERYGPGAMQIMFCNYGEPILNPNTPRLIAMAKGYLAQTALSTNLSLARFDADAYVNSGLDFMYLAIDGATQEVYSRYRQRGDIDVVYRNVERLVEAKRRLGRRAPILRWQYLAFQHNAHEIQPALEKAKALGVDQFVVEIPFDVSWDDPEIHPADVQAMQVEFTGDTGGILEGNWNPIAGKAAEIVEREFALGWTRYQTEAGRTRGESAAVPHTCTWLYKSMTLDANGRILPCCGAPKPGIDVVFGKLSNDGVDEFNSEHYLQARRSFGDRPSYEAMRATGAPTPYCANCEWNQDHTEFGSAEVAQYLKTVGRGVIDSESLQFCSNW